jgi:hypothetical protein
LHPRANTYSQYGLLQKNDRSPILFLASACASFVTGTSVMLHGAQCNTLMDAWEAIVWSPIFISPGINAAALRSKRYSLGEKDMICPWRHHQKSVPRIEIP